MGSLLYEALLLAAVLFVASWLFLVVGSRLDASLLRPLFQLYLVCVAAAYLVYCWTHGGQTLPMKTWRIRLVGCGGGGVSLRAGIYRYLLALIGLSLLGIGLVWALFDRERQFLHDRLAGTRLVMDDGVAPTC